MNARTYKGFSVLELILAFAVITMTIVATTEISTALPFYLTTAEHQLPAFYVAKQDMEAAYKAAIDSETASSFASSSDSIFTHSLSVLSLNDKTSKRLFDLVSYGKRTISLAGFVINPFSSQQNPCWPVLAGDWSKPQITTKTYTGKPFSSLTTVQNLLFVAVGNALQKAEPTLYEFDVSSSTQPVLIASIDNASTTREGVAALAAGPNIVYVASAIAANYFTCAVSASCAQLQIFKVGTSGFTQTSNYRLATTTGPFALGVNGQATGSSISIANGNVYLGLTKTAGTNGDEFNIIDAHDPTNPIWLGGFHVGRTVTSILIQGTTAYIATDDPSNELLALDISDPRNVTLKSHYDAPGTNNFGYGKALANIPPYMLLGRTYDPRGPEILTLANASNSPSEISSIVFSGLNATSTVGILVRDSLAYILTNSSLQFYVFSDPLKPVVYAAPYILPSSSGTAIACSQNTVYLSSVDVGQNGILSIITST